MKVGTPGFIFRYQKSTLQCPQKLVRFPRRVCTLLVLVIKSGMVNASTRAENK